MTQKLKIVVTGAESTGKSTIAKAIANHFNVEWIPEFAREYVENLEGPYTYEDVEAIAQKQIETERNLSNESLIVFDTWLIITKVWFDFVYGKCPGWLNEEIKNCNIDLFLVCDVDLPWIDDPVRENGGENRNKLQSIYLQELESYGFHYQIVSGEGEQRIKNAINAINTFIHENNC